MCLLARGDLTRVLGFNFLNIFQTVKKYLKVNNFIPDSRAETQYFLLLLKYALFGTSIEQCTSTVTWIIECVFSVHYHSIRSA